MSRPIAIVGLPDCGKTVLLTGLFKSDKWKIESLNKDTMIFLEQKRQEIKNGKWPEPTPDNIKAKTFIQRIYSTSAKSSVILKFRDFAGETWSRFINTYCEFDKALSPSDEGRELCDFLNESAAIAICIDLEKLFDNDINQKWITQAILNYLEKQHLSIPVALVITKYDNVKPLLQERGINGLVLSDTRHEINLKANKRRLLKIIGINSSKVTEEYVFAVSVVQSDLERYSDETQKYLPRKDSKPIGVSELENWIVKSYNTSVFIDKVKKFFKFWPMYIVLAGTIFCFTFIGQLVLYAGIILCMLYPFCFKPNKKKH